MTATKTKRTALLDNPQVETALIEAAKASGNKARQSGLQAEKAFEQVLITLGLWNGSQHLQEWQEKHEIGKQGMSASQWKEFGNYLRENGLIGPRGTYIIGPRFRSSAFGLRETIPDVAIYRYEGNDLVVEIKHQDSRGSADRKMYEVVYSTPKKLHGFDVYGLYSGDLKHFGRTLVDAMSGIFEEREENPSFRENFGGFQNIETMSQIILNPRRSTVLEKKHFYAVLAYVEERGL